jgi:hypothetical protein
MQLTSVDYFCHLNDYKAQASRHDKNRVPKMVLSHVW